VDDGTRDADLENEAAAVGPDVRYSVSQGDALPWSRQGADKKAASRVVEVLGGAARRPDNSRLALPGPSRRLTDLAQGVAGVHRRSGHENYENRVVRVGGGWRRRRGNGIRKSNRARLRCRGSSPRQEARAAMIAAARRQRDIIDGLSV